MSKRVRTYFSLNNKDLSLCIHFEHHAYPSFSVPLRPKLIIGSLRRAISKKISIPVDSITIKKDNKVVKDDSCIDENFYKENWFCEIGIDNKINQNRLTLIEEDEEKVSFLTNLGYPEPKVRKALRVAENNLSIANSILETRSIPTHNIEEMSENSKDDDVPDPIIIKFPDEKLEEKLPNKEKSSSDKAPEANNSKLNTSEDKNSLPKTSIKETPSSKTSEESSPTRGLILKLKPLKNVIKNIKPPEPIVDRDATAVHEKFKSLTNKKREELFRLMKISKTSQDYAIVDIQSRHFKDGKTAKIHLTKHAHITEQEYELIMKSRNDRSDIPKKFWIILDQEPSKKFDLRVVKITKQVHYIERDTIFNYNGITFNELFVIYHMRSSQGPVMQNQPKQTPVNQNEAPIKPLNLQITSLPKDDKSLEKSDAKPLVKQTTAVAKPENHDAEEKKQNKQSILKFEHHDSNEKHQKLTIAKSENHDINAQKSASKGPTLVKHEHKDSTAQKEIKSISTDVKSKYHEKIQIKQSSTNVKPENHDINAQKLSKQAPINIKSEHHGSEEKMQARPEIDNIEFDATQLIKEIPQNHKLNEKIPKPDLQKVEASETTPLSSPAPSVYFNLQKKIHREPDPNDLYDFIRNLILPNEVVEEVLKQTHNVMIDFITKKFN